MRSGCILLVEDNPSDVGLTRRALRRHGIPNELVVARDGQEALDYLFGMGPHAGRDPAAPPALVLLDLKLPRVDGLAVLRRIRAEPSTQTIPVVVLTTSNDASDLTAAYRLGANSYIRKPVDFQEFAGVIEQLASYWLILNQLPPNRR
ncbi:MAG: response regulator [Candidatus Methylomirabilales bacterium]